MIDYSDIVDRKNIGNLPLRFAYALSLAQEDRERAAFVVAQITSSVYRKWGMPAAKQKNFADRPIFKGLFLLT